MYYDTVVFSRDFFDEAAVQRLAAVDGDTFADWPEFVRASVVDVLSRHEADVSRISGRVSLMSDDFVRFTASAPEASAP